MIPPLEKAGKKLSLASVGGMGRRGARCKKRRLERFKEKQKVSSFLLSFLTFSSFEATIESFCYTIEIAKTNFPFRREQLESGKIRSLYEKK